MTRGEFVDTLEIRGEIRPLKSIVLSSPMQSGELQILKLAKNGTMVKAGDVVVQFDPSTLQRTIQEKQSELKQADAEIEQAQAQSRIAREQNATAVMKAGYDIQRAKLDVSKGDTVSRLDNEQAKLALVDAQQKLARARGKDQVRPDRRRGGRRRPSAASARRRCSICSAPSRGCRTCSCKAPAAGMVNVLPNFRSGSMFGGQQEFQRGRSRLAGRGDPRAAGSVVGPSRSAARRVRSRPPAGAAGRHRPDRGDPRRDFKAQLDSISVLAKVDFSSGWPPAKNFDLEPRVPRYRSDGCAPA